MRWRDFRRPLRAGETMKRQSVPGIVTVVVLLAGLAVLGASAPAAQVQTRFFGVGPTMAPADAFFSDATLHEIRLTISARDWEALKENFRDNFYYPVDFKWRNETIRSVGIRSRGTG